MLVLGIAGRLRANSFNTALLRAASRLLPPARMPLYTDLALVPPLRRPRPRARTSAGRSPPSGHRGRRRADRRHPRIQRLDPRTAQERPRLGLPPLSRQRAAPEAGRRRRRQHRHPRSRLGTSRAQKSAHHRRRARPRRRAPNRQRTRGLRREPHAGRPRPGRTPRAHPRQPADPSSPPAAIIGPATTHVRNGEATLWNRARSSSNREARLPVMPSLSFSIMTQPAHISRPALAATCLRAAQSWWACR